MRVDPPGIADETEMLTAFLDFQRETVLAKADGLSHEELHRQLPPSTLTLGGLLNHLAWAEDLWFRVRLLGERQWAALEFGDKPDAEFSSAVDVAPDELRQRYREAIDRSRAATSAATDLDVVLAVPRPQTGIRHDLRWVLLHMIEETARHAGHADLIRESIDGSTGE